MGGGGGSSSSSTATTNTDSRISQQSGTAVSGNNNTVLDGGAIKNAFDFSGMTLQKSLEFAFQSNSKTLDALDGQANLIKDAYADAKGRGALSDKIILGGMALAGVVAVIALRK